MQSGFYCSSLVHDFGAKAAGKDECAFEFTNMTLKPIVVSDADASCGCTTVSMSQRTPFTLMPLQTGRIVVTLDASGDSGTVDEAGYVFLNKSFTRRLEFEVIVKNK
jgi:hypothetical protein